MFTKIIQKIKRPVSSSLIINEIEGLRFIAIAGVLLMHLRTQIMRINPDLQTDGDWIYLITKDGGLGVNLFFSISGFILAYPFLKHYLYGQPKSTFKAFYFKRLTRLEPPFIINIVLLFAIQVFLMHGSIIALLPHFAATVTYTHTFIYGVWSNINPVTWSLETEIQFYLLAPFLFIVLYAIKNKTTRIALIVGIIILVNIGHIGTYEFLKKWHLHKSLIVFLDNFLTGMLFLEFFLWEGFKEKIRRSYIWDIVAIVAIITFFGITPRLEVLAKGLLANACIFFMFTSAFKGILFNRFVRFNIISTIGGMCYTIYLYHYAMFSILSKYTHGIAGNSNIFWVQYLVQGLVMGAIVLITCSFLFYFFEKPFMVKNWYIKKQPPETEATIKPYDKY